jgi:hypothetical protein
MLPVNFWRSPSALPVGAGAGMTGSSGSVADSVGVGAETEVGAGRSTGGTLELGLTQACQNGTSLEALVAFTT